MFLPSLSTKMNTNRRKEILYILMIGTDNFNVLYNIELAIYLTLILHSKNFHNFLEFAKSQKFHTQKLWCLQNIFKISFTNQIIRNVLQKWRSSSSLWIPPKRTDFSWVSATTHALVITFNRYAQMVSKTLGLHATTEFLFGLITQNSYFRSLN